MITEIKVKFLAGRTDKISVPDNPPGGFLQWIMDDYKTERTLDIVDIYILGGYTETFTLEKKLYAHRLIYFPPIHLNTFPEYKEISLEEYERI